MTNILLRNGFLSLMVAFFSALATTGPARSHIRDGVLW
jgi:hypothetical protein